MSKQIVANLAKDKFFLRLVQRGALIVKKSGKIINAKTGREIGNNNPKSGYVRISYQHPKTKRIYNMLAHRLVWIAFNGLIDDPTILINHKDGRKRNNRLSNLELATVTANSEHAFAIGLKNAAGENNSQAVFSDRAVVNLRKKYAAGKVTAHDIEEQYGCHRVTVHDMLIGKTYKHLSGSVVIPKARVLTSVLEKYDSAVRRMADRGLSNTAIAKRFADKKAIVVSRSSVQRYRSQQGF